MNWDNSPRVDILSPHSVPSQPVFLLKARYTRYKFCIQVSIQENLNSSLCIHDARNFDEYTQFLAGDTANKMAFLGGEEGAALCIALLCTIVRRRRLRSKKRSTWARKWLRRRRWDVFQWSLLDLQSFHYSMWLSFSCILEFPLFPPSLHNT